MKLNGTEIIFQQVDMERIDRDFIIHDSVSKKIICFNETASFVWEVILEHKKINTDADTDQIVNKIMNIYNIQACRKQEVERDVAEILQAFFDFELFKIKS